MRRKRASCAIQSTNILYQKESDERDMVTTDTINRSINGQGSTALRGERLEGLKINNMN